MTRISCWILLKPTRFGPILLILGVAFILRMWAVSGPLFDEGVSIAKYSWQLREAFQVPIDPEQSSIISGLKQVARSFRGIPNEYKLTGAVTALSFFGFGVNDYSSVIGLVLSSIGTVFLVYLICVQLFSRTVGVAAALILALLPLDIFLSSTLLPGAILTFLKLVSLYIFLLARKRGSLFLLLISCGLLLAGLNSDWKIFLPFALLFIWMLVPIQQAIRFQVMAFSSILAVILAVLIPNGISDVVNVYFSMSAIIENILFLPLISMALVFFSLTKNTQMNSLPLIWLLAEVLSLLVTAHWSVSEPLFQMVGASAYWVQLLIPSIILIAVQFEEQAGKDYLQSSVMVIGIAILSLGILLLLKGYRLPLGARTVFRIAFGLSFIAVWVYASSLLASSVRFRGLMLAGFLSLFALGNIFLLDAYKGSYAYLDDYSKQALEYLSTGNSSFTLQVAGPELYDRISYLVGFSNFTPARKIALIDSAESEVSDDSYVLTSDRFQEHVLGIPSETWQLVMQFGEGDGKLLLYHVR